MKLNSLLFIMCFVSFSTLSSIKSSGNIPTLNCEEVENFEHGAFNNWIVGSRSGSTKPYVIDGRLRMTEDRGSQSSMSVYSKIIPAKNNVIQIVYRYYSWTPRNVSSGADGVALVFSNAAITPYPGGQGGSMGYAQVHVGNLDMKGFPGGWIGIGADEYGFFANGNEGRVGGRGKTPNAISVRGSEQDLYPYLAGTASLTPGLTQHNSIDGGNGQLLRVTLDTRGAGNSGQLLVERDYGNGWEHVISYDNLQVSSLPDNFYVSLTAGTGSYYRYHEVDDFSLCHMKKAIEIDDYIDHFEFHHSGNAMTCNPEKITIKACANASCSQLVTNEVSAVLEPKLINNGSWVAIPGVNDISNGVLKFTGGSTEVYLRNNEGGAVSMGVSSSIPLTKPMAINLCQAGSSALSSAACTLNFAKSGFIFDMPDTYSNQPKMLVIKAVKQDDSSKKCTPGFANETKSIKFWNSFISPSNNPYNNATINSIQLGTSQGSATPISLTFDEDGESSIMVNYPDAGQVQLNARYDGIGNEAGLVMIGGDSFVALPVGLCVTSASGTCPSNYASCPVFKKTGATFPIQIRAMAWESETDNDICTGNKITPNFALDNIALGSTLVAPIEDGTNNASVGVTKYNHVAATNGINHINQTVDEVGVFKMNVSPPDRGYFGYTIPVAESPPLGRFIPADFHLNSGDIVPACGIFSYMGQPFGVELDVQARNQSGRLANNYTGAFAKGTADLSVANNKDGKSLSARLTTMTSLSWVNGRAIFKGTSSLARLLGTQPDGPYTSLLFGIYINDNDGNHSLISNPDFNDTVAGNCTASDCNARLIDNVPMRVYFGRLFAGTQAGLATADLAVPLELQYYEAGNWQLNKFDQCTQLSLAAQGFSFLNPNHSFDVRTGDLYLSAGRTIKLGLGSSSPGALSDIAKDGEIRFHFTKPGIAVRIPYKVNLVNQPSSPLWLSDPLTMNGEVIFGATRGNDRVIYRREIFQ